MHYSDIMDDPEFQEIAQGFSDSASDNIALFSKKYFGKDIKCLTQEEHHEIDCWGLYGCIAWLEDNGHLEDL